MNKKTIAVALCLTLFPWTLLRAEDQLLPNDLDYVLLNKEVRTKLFRAIKKAKFKNPTLVSASHLTILPAPGTPEEIPGKTIRTIHLLITDKKGIWPGNVVLAEVRFSRSDGRIFTLKRVDSWVEWVDLIIRPGEERIEFHKELVEILLSKKFDNGYKAAARQYATEVSGGAPLIFKETQREEIKDENGEALTQYQLRCGAHGGEGPADLHILVLFQKGEILLVNWDIRKLR